MGIDKELHITSNVGSIYTDSQSALSVIKNHVYHDRSKHVNGKVHFVHELVSDVDINLLKINVVENPVDMGT